MVQRGVLVFYRIFCLAVWLFLLLPLLAFGAPVSATVPLDSWVYPALDKLAGLGLIDSALQGTRPYTRLEVARQLGEARDHLGQEGSLPVAEEIVSRMEREFAAELAVAPGEGSSYLLPLRELRLDYVYQQGVPAVIAGPGIVSRQFPLDTNNFGIDYQEHHNLQASFASEARLGRYFLLAARPLLLVNKEDGADLSLLEGKAAVALGPFEISAGRQALWWGQGRHGSLILTDNAPPLDMLRITNPVPLRLPWLLRYLGPFRFDVFWSRLEDDRVVPKPYFAGLRLTLEPVPWFEIGASRTVIFGGEGRPDVNLPDFFTILGGKNQGGSEDTSNQIAALDGRLRLPVLGGMELYGEWGGEDEAAGSLANTAWLGGLFLAGPDPAGRLSLRLEFADLSRLDNNSAPWYRHGLYASGYTYKGRILGEAVGGAARDLYSELRAILSADLTLSLSLDYQERGFDQPLHEKHLEPGFGADWQLTEQIAVDARYAFDQVKNFGYVAGPGRTFHLATVGVRTRW
jgi:Capsule assembly protein Wzi